MVMYKVGDTVVQWTYGIGKIVDIADKGLSDQPCFYYVIEGNEQTLWVPVEERENSSLHMPTSSGEFGKFISILRSPGKMVSGNPQQRRNELEQRMQKRRLVDTCLLIRDLNHSSYRRKLSSNDFRVLNYAESFLLDE